MSHYYHKYYFLLSQVICQQYVKQNMDGEQFCTFRSPELTQPQPLPHFIGRDYINYRIFDPNQQNSSW